MAKSTKKWAPAPLTADLPPSLLPPAGMTSGCYIRSLVMLGHGTDRIVELVRKHFKGSRAKGSDVSWNRGRLRAAGRKVPAAIRS